VGVKGKENALCIGVCLCVNILSRNRPETPAGDADGNR
jgi:hypothetical protein